MTGHERYRAVAERLWPDVRRAFNYPLLRDVGLADPDGAADPAPVRRADDRVVLSTSHLDAFDPDANDDEWLVDALLKHEVGHYALFPRELAPHLRYLQHAEEAFGEERGYGFYALYADVCNEPRLLRSHIGDAEVLDHRERILEATTAAGPVPTPAMGTVPTSATQTWPASAAAGSSVSFSRSTTRRSRTSRRA